MTYKMSSYGPSASGVALRGMPVLNTYGASVFWVDSNGGGGSKGTFLHPCRTLNEAYDLCTADKGDIVMVKPSHAETITATVALDTAGVSIIGLGNGSQRPKISYAPASGPDNGFEASAVAQRMENIWFYDLAAAGTAPEVFIDVQAGGDDFTMVDCRFEQREIVEEAVTVAYGADDVSFIGCEFIGTSPGPAYGIIAEGMVKRMQIIGCTFNYEDSGGIDAASICFSSGASTGILIKDCYFTGNTDGEEAIAVSDNAFDDGLIVNCFGKVADLTDAIIQSDEMSVINSYFVEGMGAFAGAAIGSLSTNAHIPATTTIP